MNIEATILALCSVYRSPFSVSWFFGSVYALLLVWSVTQWLST